MVSLLSPVVRQFLKKDTKYCRTVVYTRACRLGDLVYVCAFSKPVPRENGVTMT